MKIFFSMKRVNKFESDSISHEVLSASRVEKATDRNFGLVFCVFFALLSVFFWWNENPYFEGSLLLASAFLLLSLIWPRLLSPLNNIWFYFGKLLHLIVSPLVMGVIFFLFMVPIGLVMKLVFRYDPLQLKDSAPLESYWINRENPVERESFRDQF